MFDVLECDRPSRVPLLGGEHIARCLDRVTSLEQCDDNLGACVLPSRIPDRNEVAVPPDTDPIEHLPRRVEQRMVRMGGRKGDDEGPLTCPPPTLLREEQLRVCFAPSQSALALSMGVRRAPVAEVVGGTPPEATVRLSTLLAASFRVTSTIPSFTLTGTATSGVGVVALTGADLVDTQAQAVGELSSAGVTALSRHDLRRWAASHGRTPVERPQRGCRATSAAGCTRHRLSAAHEARRAVGGSVRPAVYLTAARRNGRRPPPADFPPNTPYGDLGHPTTDAQ